MTVAELMVELGKLPAGKRVLIWDDCNDWVPVSDLVEDDDGVRIS